jgi:4-amino-4-deoxy-L-arabinose transferase-like glycosyltransferase
MRHKLPVFLLALLLAAATVRCVRLMPTGIATGDEALTALRSLGILEQGHGWTPYWNGEPDVHKPPLYYWMVAAGYQVLGVGEPAIRLPSMVAFLCLLALTYGLGRRVFDPWTGLVAALLAGLHPTLAAQSCVGMLDTTMIALSIGAACCLLRSERHPRWFLGWGLCCGLALLTKGEGAVPILLASFLYLLWVRLEAFRIPHLYGGLLLAAVLAGGWFGSQFVLHRDIFLKPHYRDFVDYRFKHSWRDTALYLKSLRYLWASWGGLAPFVVAAPLWVWLRELRRRRGDHGPTDAPSSPELSDRARGAALIALVGVVPLVMVSLVRQQKQWYMLPAVVPMALFAGRMTVGILRGEGRLAFRVLPGALLCVGLLLPNVCVGPPVLRWLAGAAVVAAVVLGVLRPSRPRTAGAAFSIGLVVATATGLSMANPLVNLLRPRDSVTSQRLAELLPTTDAMPGYMVVNFEDYPLNTLMFYTRRNSRMLRAFSRQSVPPGARYVGVLVKDRYRDFLRGLEVRVLAEHAGHEVVSIANASTEPITPCAPAEVAPEGDADAD